MDNLFYSYNTLSFGESDLTKDELDKLSGVALGSLVGFRKELFKVESVNPLMFVIVQNAAIGE